jgi:hypothetical protein
LDFIACLAALMPKLRVNLTGFHWGIRVHRAFSCDTRDFVPAPED